MSAIEQSEWLEADGLGGFASGTVSGIRTRRYHALLLPATTPPTGRVVLVNGFDAWLVTPLGRFAISAQRYAGDVVHPDGATRIASFTRDPWPTWTYTLPDGTKLTQEIFAVHERGLIVLSWRLIDQRDDVGLEIRPFLSGRDYHSMHHENASFVFAAEMDHQAITWRPYGGLPAVTSVTNAAYSQQPDWYRRFSYAVERERGLDDTEDLASPGTFRWDLAGGEGVWILGVDKQFGESERAADALELADTLRAVESRRRRKFSSPLHRSADAYIVRRGRGRTIVAGYPWFTDWGRDTFIAIRGLCLATGRLKDARDILIEWAGAVSEGMLPNRFPDAGGEPEFNSVDASLWYVIAVHDLLAAAEKKPRSVTQRDRRAFQQAIEQILDGYSRGTRHGIRMDQDGLLAAGVPGVQLTWMDAKVGDWVVTPRIGKPVEVQALWLNALWVASQFSDRWRAPYEKGREAFGRRFWNEHRGMLYDVVDVDHQSGAVDDSFRPNQILAVGGLPLPILEGARARSVVDLVEKHLLTPLGLRSLAPGEPGYTPHYEGGPAGRDSVYHQGTVWAWLIGPFVDAWLNTRANTDDAREEARARFLQPLLTHLDEAGLGHISEIADADPPHTPRGCPFQAWSLGELIRITEVLRF